MMFFNHKNTEPEQSRSSNPFSTMAEIIPEKHQNPFIIPESRTTTCVFLLQHTSEKCGAIMRTTSIWKGCI